MVAKSSIKIDDGKKKLDQIGKIILVGSGKGGVGKSFVSCGLGLRLSSSGFKTGLFDMDIHGASVPNYLGIGPPLRSTRKGLEPKRVGRNLKVMSVSLLTGNNPVPMHGIEKEDMLSRFFALTNWAKLDYLIVDLPPSTGDELLSAFSLFSDRSKLLIVTKIGRASCRERVYLCV